MADPDQKRGGQVIVPESTIESASNNRATGAPKPRSNFRCESTVHSGLRRNFIKNAALATAAVGIGGSLLGKNILPQSAARSDCLLSVCTAFAGRSQSHFSGEHHISLCHFTKNGYVQSVNCKSGSWETTIEEIDKILERIKCPPEESVTFDRVKISRPRKQFNNLTLLSEGTATSMSSSSTKALLAR